VLDLDAMLGESGGGGESSIPSYEPDDKNGETEASSKGTKADEAEDDSLLDNLDDFSGKKKKKKKKGVNFNLEDVDKALSEAVGGTTNEAEEDFADMSFDMRKKKKKKKGKLEDILGGQDENEQPDGEGMCFLFLKLKLRIYRCS